MKFGTSVLALALLASSSVMVAEANPLKPSMREQVNLGQRAIADVDRQFDMLPDSDARVRLIRRLGDRLVNAIKGEENRPWEYKFSVIDKNEINAFALPGGPIYFFSGLIDIMDSEDELAAVLAHEIAHVRREHWARRYADEQARSIGITVLALILSPGRTAVTAASVANDLLVGLPYSRAQENEADRMGIELMVDAGFNPNAAITVMERLQQNASRNRPPQWLSTHPDTNHRIRAIRAQIDRMGSNWPRLTPMPAAVTELRPKDDAEPQAVSFYLCSCYH
jgi:predicted Zn-dependent protease